MINIKTHSIKQVFTSFLILVLVISGTGIAGRKRKQRFDCSEKVQRAITQFEKKHHNNVKTILNTVKIQCSGHPVADTALYYLGKAYLATRNPVEASMELEVLINDFPNSVFNEEVRYLLGYCCYKESHSYERDQIKTKEAIRKLSDFIEMFPESPFADSAKYYLRECNEKLVEKEFMSARFYEKIDRYDAAIVYYKIIIENFPESDFIEESKLALAKNLIRVNRPTEAADILDAIMDSSDDKEIIGKAKQLRSHIKKSEDNQESQSDDSDVKKTFPDSK